MRFRRYGLCLALLTALPACPDNIHDLPPGALHETCLLLVAGETLRYRFQSTAPLDFGIHYHDGDEIHHPLEPLSASQGSGHFVAPEGRSYCLMWTNSGNETVTLTTVIGED